jgi:ABC-type branched-subunit amino acid transport system substrate-binding protein
MNFFENQVLSFAARIVASLATTLWCAVAWSDSYGVTPDEIVLHHVGPLKNAVLAASNNEALDGADLYLQGLNQKGGVNGRKITIQRHDDGQDPKRTLEIVTQLVRQRSGLAFLMPRTTPSTEAMMPLLEASGIPLIGPQSGASSITEPMKRHVFAIRATYGDEVVRAIELQHSLGRTRFGFLVANDAFGNDVIKVAIAKLASINLKPVTIELVDNRTPDITAAVKAFAQSKPEVILLICNAKSGADFIKTHSKVDGFKQFIAISNSSNSGFVSALGPAGRGVMVMQVLPSPQTLTSRIVQDYNGAMALAKKPISYNSFQGYVTAALIAEGIRRAGRNPTPSSLISALEGLEKFDLGGYFITYGKNNRLGSKFVEPTMINKEGRFI